MKKFLFTLTLSVVLLTCVFAIGASAERTQWMPVTLTQSGYYSDTLFTITSVDLDKPYLYTDSDKLYQKEIYLSVKGYFGSDITADGEITLYLYCYDASGNHIDTEEFTINNEYGDLYEYGSYHNFDVPDVTASVEIASKNPGSWSNSLFICNYRNVWAADGRVLGIPELMLPVYENVGWFGDVSLYSLDGRYIEVPYPDVAAYKNVGWYEYNEYAINSFRQEYRNLLAKYDYKGIMNLAEGWLYDLKGTIYEQELYTAKTYAMDAWRKAANAPMGLNYSYVYNYNGYTNIDLTFRNVSYKTIKAFKCEFVCYDVFGGIERQNSVYYSEDAYIYSGETESFTWKVYNDDIDRISTPVITQVVYSDGTSWYR